MNRLREFNEIKIALVRSVSGLFRQIQTSASFVLLLNRFENTVTAPFIVGACFLFSDTDQQLTNIAYDKFTNIYISRQNFFGVVYNDEGHSRLTIICFVSLSTSLVILSLSPYFFATFRTIYIILWQSCELFLAF